MTIVLTRGVHGNGEDWDPMGMGVKSAMGWEWEWELSAWEWELRRAPSACHAGPALGQCWLT